MYHNFCLANFLLCVVELLLLFLPLERSTGNSLIIVLVMSFYTAWILFLHFYLARNKKVISQEAFWKRWSMIWRKTTLPWIVLSFPMHLARFGDILYYLVLFVFILKLINYWLLGVLLIFNKDFPWTFLILHKSDIGNSSNFYYTSSTED